MILKKILKWIIAIALIVFCFLLYKLTTFTIFDEENKLIKELEVPNKNYSLKIYYVPPNATDESYIQIRKKDTKNEVVLENFKRYNFLNYCKIINGDTIEISIRDTSRVDSNNNLRMKLP